MRTGLVGCRGRALGDCVKYIMGRLPGRWEHVRFVKGCLGKGAKVGKGKGLSGSKRNKHGISEEKGDKSGSEVQTGGWWAQPNPTLDIASVCPAFLHSFTCNTFQGKAALCWVCAGVPSARMWGRSPSIMGTLQVWSASTQMDVCGRSLCQPWEKGLQSTGTAGAGPAAGEPRVLSWWNSVWCKCPLASLTSKTQLRVSVKQEGRRRSQWPERPYGWDWNWKIH